MKIGILTFHNVCNYGAVLQTYATQKLFEGMKCNVEIIDYRNRTIEKDYSYRKILFSRFLSKWFKKELTLLIIFHFIKKRNRKFGLFSETHLNISKEKYNLKTFFISGYDIILIGSDQVWNPRLTGDFDLFYWGGFEKDKDTKVVAWAASSREIHFSDTERDKIKGYLSNFTAISVRECDLKDYISGLTDKKVSQILDPTLLLNREQWLNLCKPTKKKNYVLIYAVFYEVDTIALGKRLAKAKGLDYIIITSMCNSKVNKHYKQCVSPEEFVSYINDANYIVACSFHGTAFSVIFQKQFFCYIKDSTHNMRIESLLDQVGLNCRIVSDNTSFNNIERINYSEVNQKLETLKTESMKFVDEILK